MESDQPVLTNPKKNNRLNISLSWPVVVVVLLGVIVAMLLIWKPWYSEPTSDDRTISVEGQAKIVAEPDEYVFNPSWEFKNSNKKTSLNDLTKKSTQVIKALKDLGVEDSKIKSNSSGYNYDYYYSSTDKTFRYTLSITVTVNNKELTQKVQDYLLTSGPTGSVSPYATFSEQKRKDLENQARDEATKDARAKADQSAQNLGFKVHKVKSVSDGTGFGGIEPYLGASELSLKNRPVEDQKLSVQPGENDLNYSVTVVYYIR